MSSKGIQSRNDKIKASNKLVAPISMTECIFGMI